MKLVNHTPFPAMVFEARDLDDVARHVLVVRGTMTLRGVPRLSQQQSPLVMGDTHHGDPATSSTRDESDLAPFKPRTDVLVRGTARAPGGVPAGQWEASVTVGSLSKRVRVTGPRAWLREGDRWRLSAPTPVASVPLRYELAYGGTAREGDREDRCEQNPVGVGYAPPWFRDGKDHLAAPQIELPDDPLVDIDRPIAPAGFGPLGKAWLPRRASAGTYDDAWVRSRWPTLPRDFDAAFWNCAPHGLVAPGYLAGDEHVTLTGFDPRGPIAFRLPGHTVFTLLRHRVGVMLPFTMRLDTVTVDVDAMEVGLVWRFVTAVDPPIRDMEVRMIFNEPNAAEAPRHG